MLYIKLIKIFHYINEVFLYFNNISNKLNKFNLLSNINNLKISIYSF